MIIDLIGGSYHNNYPGLNPEKTINWYPVAAIKDQAEKNKVPVSLLPRPGLSTLVDLTGTCVRGLFTARSLTQERCFAVVGRVLYEIYVDGTSTNRGSLTNMLSGSKAKVYMELNGNGDLFIQDSAAAYYFNLSTNTLTQVTDADYPGGKTLTYLDGYFVISDNSGRVTFSELNSAANWVGDSVFTPTFKSDPVKAVAAFREEIFCFGTESIEIYINDGVTPFIRQSRTSLYYGIAAPDSLATWHGGHFFLGGSRFGETEVYLLQSDYTIKQISSPGISSQLNLQTARDAEGYVQQSKDGHIFYHLHVPALKTTYVYDATLNIWHERQSQRPYPDNDGEKPDDMYRGRLHTNFKGKNLYGDWFSGKILKEDTSVSTDDGLPRKLIRRSPVYNQELKNISVYQLEVDVNTGYGSDPTMMVSWSLDGGNTFESEQTIELGALGEYNYRGQINKLGTARNWVIELKVTDPIDLIVMQARATGAFGAW